MCVLVNLLIVYFGFNITFDMDCFRVGSVNVNGAREGKKRASIFETAKIKKVDVLFLQETHSDGGNEADWRKEWEGEAILSHGTSEWRSRLPLLQGFHSGLTGGRAFYRGEATFSQSSV